VERTIARVVEYRLVSGDEGIAQARPQRATRSRLELGLPLTKLLGRGLHERHARETEARCPAGTWLQASYALPVSPGACGQRGHDASSRGPRRFPEEARGLVLPPPG